jgi:predicted nucleic acid-binding protein
VIVLDTNVVSEPIKPKPDARVLNWIAQRPESLAVTTVTVGELLTGARLLPLGSRRKTLMNAIESILLTRPARLPYDENAARAHAVLQEEARASGRPLAREDGMIAGICVSRGAVLATRNTSDFEHLPVDVINPWELA